MSNRPNRARNEAPAMSFEQQVAQVLDSLTKELPMSEPPTGPLGAANEYAACPELLASDKILEIFRRWRESNAIPEDEETDESVAENFRLSEDMGKLPANTAVGVVIKLSYYAYSMFDHHAAEGRDEDHPVIHLKRTLLEAADRFGGTFGEAIRFGTIEAEARMNELHKASTERLEFESKAKEWGRLESIFQKYATEEQRDRWFGERKPAQTYADLSEQEMSFLKDWRNLPKEQRELVIEGMSLLNLQEKVHRSLMEVERRFGTLASYRRMVAEDLAELDAAIQAERSTSTQPVNSNFATDAFSETIAEFEADASATLSMPLEMSDRMIDAGASAAGITPEQFKAAVIAARDARAA